MPDDETPSAGRRLRIVHADPAQGFLRIAAEELTTIWGDRLDVMSFADGEAAANYLLVGRKFRCDLALIDAGLPEPADAVELIRIVRDCDAHCPVILTRYEDTPVDRSLLAMRIDVLQKPFRIEQLSETIRSSLSAVKRIEQS